MFEQLHHQLEWTNTKSRNEILLITSKGTDGGFLLHHFISYYIKQAYPVCLVTLAQTFAHYSQAGLKIGANLDRSKKRGHLHHIDLLARLTHSYLAETGQSNERTGNVESTGLDGNLENIFNKIKTLLVDSFKTTAQYNESDSDPALLVIDDLSMLLSWGFSEKDVLNFVHYLMVLCKTRNVLLVTLMPVIEDEQLSVLRKNVEHISESIIRVNNLPSGYSKDIHGHLQILKRGKKEDSQMQYKLSDKNLIIFPKGTSPAVV